MAEIRHALSTWDPDDGEAWRDQLTAEYDKRESELLNLERLVPVRLRAYPPVVTTDPSDTFPKTYD